jgi:hypothetical protein
MPGDFWPIDTRTAGSWPHRTRSLCKVSSMVASCLAGCVVIANMMPPDWWLVM